MTLDLDPIKQRAEAATEGPWGARELPQMVRGANATLHSAHGTGEVWSVEFSPEIGSTVSISDAEFIAAARTDIPALLDEVERLRDLHKAVSKDLVWNIGRANKANETIQRVRELHRQNTQTDGECQGYDPKTGKYGYLKKFCVECSNQSGREYGTAYPCDTAIALDGTQ